MSLTCSFRCLAGQVKHRLAGTQRRRSSSSHECNCPWEAPTSIVAEPSTHARSVSCQRSNSPTRVRPCPERLGVTNTNTALGPDAGLGNANPNMHPYLLPEQRESEQGCQTFHQNPSSSHSLSGPSRQQRPSAQGRRRATQTLTLIDPTQADRSPQTHRTGGNVHAANNSDYGNTGQQTPSSVRSISSTPQEESQAISNTRSQHSQNGSRHFSPHVSSVSYRMSESSPKSNSVGGPLVNSHQEVNTKRSPTAKRSEDHVQIIPDFSTPEVGHHSGSLGSTVPYFYGANMQKMQRYLGPSWNDLSIHSSEVDMKRMNMSYTGLNELKPQENSGSCQEMHRSQQLCVTDHHNNREVPSNSSMTSSSYSHQEISSNLSNPSMSPHFIRPKPVTASLQVPSVSRANGHLKTQPALLPNTTLYDSAEEVAPVLPTRSTSLLARQWNHHLDQVQYTASMDCEANRPKRTSSRSTGCSSKYFPNLNSLASSSQVDENSGYRSTHLRSRSELVRSSRRCYVNATEEVPTIAEVHVPSNAALGNQEMNPTERLTGSSINDPVDGPTQLPESTVMDTANISATSSSNSETDLRDLSNHSFSLKYPAIPVSVPNSPSCGALEQFMPTNHATRLLGRMSDKLRDGRLADVILLADRTTGTSKRSLTEQASNSTGDNEIEVPKQPMRIPAHRVILAAASDYFAAMFGNELKEATEMEIRIHDVDPAALQTLVNYIYTGFLDLREDTVEDILEAACFLQMPEASQACERFLIKRLHGSNCLGMSRLGEQYGCRLLRHKATKYALEHFTEVVQQPDFLTLSVTELMELLRSDHLKVPNEAAVFAACLRWMRNTQRTQHTPPQNTSILKGLLNLVRLQHVPARLLVDVLEKEPLFQTDMEATRMLITALRFQLSPEPKPAWMMDSKQSSNAALCSKVRLGLRDDYRLEQQGSSHGIVSSYSQLESSLSHATSEANLPTRQSPRPSTIGHLWALGGKTMTTTRALQEILEYDPYTNHWRVVGQLPGQRQQCGCIVLNDGRLLVVGGRDELKTLSTVECIYTEELSPQMESHLTRSVTLNRDDRDGGWLAGESSTLSRKSRQLSTDRDPNAMTRSVIDTRTDANSTTEVKNPYPHQQQQKNNENNNEHAAGWHVVSAMATHRHGLGVAVLEGVVYAVGGHDGWSYLNTVERWNGRAKSWSSVTPMAVQRSTVGVAALDGLLYAVGGRDGSACLRTVERFNPHTQHWCFIAPMLHRRGGVGVAAAGGRLYAVGGHNAPPSQPHAVRTASVEMYDPQTDMWSEVASLSSPRDSIAVTTLGTKLYAIGGHDGLVYTDRVQVFDPETNEWSEAASLPSGRAGVAVASSQPFGLLVNQTSRLPYYKADPLA
ncbi:putative bacteriochlorophyll 4-vinyl reductase [Opisthorchis viverrini]|uniref:Putative bacteriochlorophyll 4-vinyl reductase n=1 Tax=Opisthorchis viverrini TaxID=6198 RepID=A0A1S8X8L7_OPIVI|nr:putative bacteriochlorophyll 4-vinyl reductase [Opisthorchis viverrini]